MRRLLIRPGAIGDCILSLPELESARADHTEVWVPRPIVPLVQFADHTRAIPDTGLDLLGVVDDDPRAQACLRNLAAFDSIYSWYGANRPEFRDAVRHLPFTFFPALPINITGAPRIHVPAVPTENRAVIHPFSGSAKKNWPLDLYRELSQRINATLDLPVTWIAGPDESLDPAVRIPDLYDLACWLASARVYIGNDSGISHLAAAVGLPVVAIFLSTDPRVWAPRGDRVVVLENPTVAQVAAATPAIVRPIRR